MVIARKIAYNVVVNAAAKVLSTILALVAIGLVMRYLGKDGFGDYATVIAFFSFFGSVADLGLYAITAREISRDGADERSIINNVFTLRAVSSFIVFLLTPLLVIFLPYSWEVKAGIVIAGASFVFSSTYMVLNGLFQKHLSMDRVAIAEIIGKISQVAIIFGAIHLNLGFVAIVSSVLVSMIVNFVLVLIAARKFVKLRLQFDLAYWKRFMKESLPMGIAVVITFFYFKMDTILLSVLKSSSDVGIYNAAYKVIENLTFFPSMIIGLMLPIMSRNIFSDRQEFKRISNETFKVFVLMVVPIVIGGFFLAENIVTIIGGAEFIESAQTLRILIFALAFIFFGNFFNNILIAASKQKVLMYSLSVCAIFNIGANMFLIPKFSYMAAASVSVATEALVVAITFYLTSKYVDYVPKFKNVFGIIASGVMMALFLFFFSDQNFIFVAIGSAIIYGLFLWVTRTITAKELLSIVSKKQTSPSISYE